MKNDRIGPGRASAIVCALVVCGWCIVMVLGTDRALPHVYVYNLPPPQLRVIDGIGRIALTITIPHTTPPGEERSASGASASWTREVGGRAVVNTVERIGVLLEMRTGTSDWAPLQVPGIADQGLVRMGEGDQATLTIATTEPWVRHTCHARTLIAATGYPLTRRPDPQGAIPDETVLVYGGIFPSQPVPWPELAYLVEQGSPEALVADHFLLGDERSRAGVAARAGIRYYLSGVSREAALVPSSDTRIAFLRAIDIPGDPKGSGAELLLSHVIRGSGNQDGHWLTVPIRCIVYPGDPISVETVVPDPMRQDKLKTEVRLTVPYRLVEVQHSVRRCAGCIVRPQSRPTLPGKDFAISSKEFLTDAAVLADASGVRITLPQLHTIRLSPYHGAITYPTYPSTDYDEQLAFSSDPGTFCQRGLIRRLRSRMIPGPGPSRIAGGRPGIGATPPIPPPGSWPMAAWSTGRLSRLR